MSYTEIFQSLRWIMSNKVYDEMLSDMLNAVRRGESPYEVMQMYTKIIPKDVVAILKVWETTASVPESIDNALSLYETEFKSIINNFSKVVEPILIIFVWGVVLWIALSIFGILGSILDSINNM